MGLKAVFKQFSMLIYKCKTTVEEIFIEIETNRTGQICKVNWWAVKLRVCLSTFCTDDFN